MERLYIGKQDGTWFTAMTYEISGWPFRRHHDPLEVGEAVNLSPVVGKRVEAIVRRKQGAICGFEFVGLGPKIVEQIQKLCEALPLFQSMIDVCARKTNAGALRSGTLHKSQSALSGGILCREKP